MQFLKFFKQDFALDDDAKMLKMCFRIHATIIIHIIITNTLFWMWNKEESETINGSIIHNKSLEKYI